MEFAPCDAEGRTYEAEEYGRTEPEHPADGALFLKVEDIRRPWSSDSTLEIYSAVSGNWSAIPLDYCRVTAEGIGKGFRAWDTVTVQGTAAKQGGQFEELDGDRIVYEVQEGWLRVKATPGGAHFYGKFAQNGTTAKWTSIDGSEVAVYTVEGPVQVERKIPDLDFVTECDNRVWGCSSKENVIYACKLGDPTNWFSYRGIAADSYAVTVGSDGPFTGAATCMGYALFFKENALHKLYGSKPSDFQLTALPGRGPECGPQPLRAERDSLLSLGRRGDGVGRQPAHQGVHGAGCRPALQRAAGAGRSAGRAVLPLSLPRQRGRKHDPAAGV